MIPYIWAVARALGKNPASLFVSIFLVLVQKRILGRKPRRVLLFIKDRFCPFFIRDAGEVMALYEVFVKKAYEHKDASVTEVVDIGAHVGSAALYFASTYPEARVRSYEPDPENFAMLTLNTAAFPRIECHNVAVSDLEGEIPFYVNVMSMSSSTVEREGSKKITVRSVTLDQILTGPADIVKFDIEGAEYRMFAASKLRSIPRILIGEVHYDLMGTGIEGFIGLFPEHRSTIHPMNEKRALVVLEKNA